MINKLLLILGLLIILAIAFFIYSTITAPTATEGYMEPINITDDPIQTDDKESILPPIDYRNVKFFCRPQAKYKIGGTLISTHRYSDGFWSKLSPFDYAVCWGNVPQMFPYVKFHQVSRFCLFRYKRNSPVDVGYILRHMSNNHMIPSNQNIRRALKKGHKGQQVEIEGYLVYVEANVKKHGSLNWNSSITREDDGNGACEIIYVTKLRLDDKLYE